MEMKEINRYCNELEWLDVTEDAPECGRPVIIKSEHSYPMVAFRLMCDGKPINHFIRPPCETDI